MTFRQFINNVFRWQHGRQQSGYDKMLLLTGRLPLPFDCYLLRFSQGAAVPTHKDQVDSGKHYRLNIILWKAIAGGEFCCSNTLFENARVKLFRPDISEHSVTEVKQGVRYVFSLGWVRAS